MSGNQVSVSACLGWMVIQVLKTVINVALNRSFTSECLAGSGGMPSSRPSTVCAPVVSSGVYYGVGSFGFAVSFVLAAMVTYDTISVRRGTGKQAELPDMIMEQNILKIDSEYFQQRLKEFVGRMSLQVFTGTILGVGIALLISSSYVQT